MQHEKFDHAIKEATFHMRHAAKHLFAALGHADGQVPEFEQVTTAATQLLQMLAKIREEPEANLGNVKALRRETNPMEGHSGL
jgi:hypothetical protein